MRVTADFYYVHLHGDNDDQTGWTKDGSNKQDYDPCAVELSCRVYSDGFVARSIYCGDTEVMTWPQRQMATVEKAKRWVEEWCRIEAEFICGVVKAAYDNRQSQGVPEPQAEPVPAYAIGELASFEPEISRHDHFAAAALTGMLFRGISMENAPRLARIIADGMVEPAPVTNEFDALAAALANFHVPGEYEGYPGEAERLATNLTKALEAHGLVVTFSRQPGAPT